MKHSMKRTSMKPGTCTAKKLPTPLVASDSESTLRERFPKPGAGYSSSWRQALIVLAMSIAMVMGPTPPGTGVMASHFGATAS